MRRAVFLAAGLALAGCSSLDPGGTGIGPSSGATVPAGAPQFVGVKPQIPAQQRRLVAMFGGRYNAPKAETLLNTILAKLAAASDNPAQVYKVTILNSPAVNAFALPTGDLFVTRGLLALANDQAEIAAVMAHEIAHVTLRHAYQREEAIKTAALRSQVATQLQSRTKGAEVRATSQLNLASFSRQQELEADGIGVKTISRAGFDPYGAARFLRSLGRSAALRAAISGRGKSELGVMSSHPSTPERIRRAILTARQVGAPGIGRKGRKNYLSAINGIDFGDDPAEGIVRRRKFVHGKLGFKFTAPRGFILENSAQALVGVAKGGNQALRLDSVQIEAGQSLADYLKTGWIQGLQQESVRTARINGLPAALAKAASKGWLFRVAVIRHKSDVYRIIFAAKKMSSSVDRAFARSIRSFASIPVAEARRLRALRLAVVAARRGDTKAKVARRMIVGERATRVFGLINALRSSDRLVPGRLYKIVVD